VRDDIWLASVAEMADRVYMNDWSDNLESAFFQVLIDQGTGIENTLMSERPATDQHRLNIIPNPFMDETTIQFFIRKNTLVSLNIYDSRGKLVQNISAGEYLPGNHQVLFSGREMPPGIYYCRLQSGRFAEYKKMILLKHN